MTAGKGDARPAHAYVPQTSTEMDLSYRMIRATFRLLLSLLCRLRVEGLEHLPRRGPLIILTNHLHFLDPPVIMAALPVRTTALTAEKWETRPIINRLFKAVGAVFIHRGAADIGALRAVEGLLRQGAIVGIAPEGTRSPNGALQKGKGGAAFLASRTGATLVPAVAYGQEKVFKALRRFRRADVVVRIGEPFVLPAIRQKTRDVPVGETHRNQQIEAMTTDIMLRLARLLPPEYRGLYRPLVPDNALEAT